MASTISSTAKHFLTRSKILESNGFPAKSKVDLPGNNKLNQSKKARAPEIYGSADKKVIVSKDSIIIDGVTITACAKCRLENNKTAIQCRIQKQCTYPQYKSDNAIVSYSNVSQNQNLGLRPLDNTIDYDSYVPKYKEIAAFLGIKQQPPKPPPKRPIQPASSLKPDLNR